MATTSFDLTKITSIETLLTHLLTVSTGAFKDAAKTNAKYFAYDGFNAVEILTNFYIVFRNNKNDAEALTELCDIVTIGLTRGNIRKDQLERTPAEGKLRIERLSAKYNILMRKNKNDRVTLANSSLTFTRAISVFPFVASQIINSGVCVVEPNGCKFGSDALPSVMKHPGFASLIPRGGNYSDVIFQCYVAYTMSFGRKINPNNKDDDKKWYERQKQFSNAAWTNLSLIDNAYRIKAFEILGLNSHTKYGDVYLTVCNNLRKAIGQEPVTIDLIQGEIVDGFIKVIG